MLFQPPPQWSRAKAWVVALLDHKVQRGLVKLQPHVAVDHARVEAVDLQLGDAAQLLWLQWMEEDDLVQSVEKLWAKRAAHQLHDAVVCRRGGVAVRQEQLAADVAGHDDDRVGKGHRAPFAVGQAAVVQHTQEHVEHFPVRLFDLIQKHDAVGATTNRLGELAP